MAVLIQAATGACFTEQPVLHVPPCCVCFHWFQSQAT